MTRVAAFHFLPQVRVFLGELADRPRRLNGDGRLRRQRFQDLFILRVEPAVALVQHFESADHFSVNQVLQRHGQQVASAVTGLDVDGGVKTGVAVGVADIDHLASQRRHSGNALAGVEANDLVAAERHLRPELHRAAIEKENAGPVGVQKARRSRATRSSSTPQSRSGYGEELD